MRLRSSRSFFGCLASRVVAASEAQDRRKRSVLAAPRRRLLSAPRPIPDQPLGNLDAQIESLEKESLPPSARRAAGWCGGAAALSRGQVLGTDRGIRAARRIRGTRSCGRSATDEGVGYERAERSYEFHRFRRRARGSRGGRRGRGRTAPAPRRRRAAIFARRVATTKRPRAARRRGGTIGAVALGARILFGEMETRERDALASVREMRDD